MTKERDTRDRLTKASNNLSLQLQRADEPKNDKKDLMRALNEFVDAKIAADTRPLRAKEE